MRYIWHIYMFEGSKIMVLEGKMSSQICGLLCMLPYKWHVAFLWLGYH
jgi:hypothetical protein